MSDEINDSAALDSVFDECIRRGYVNGLDFFVEGHDAVFSSELVVLARRGGPYEVVYRDMGRNDVLASGADVESVRDVFLQAVERLASGRGRGTVAPRPHPTEKPSDEEILARFLARNPRVPRPE